MQEQCKAPANVDALNINTDAESTDFECLIEQTQARIGAPARNDKIWHTINRMIVKKDTPGHSDALNVLREFAEVTQEEPKPDDTKTPDPKK